MSLQRLQQALRAKQFQILEQKEPSPLQLRLIGRVPEEEHVADSWLLAIGNLWRGSLTDQTWLVEPVKLYRPRPGAADLQLVYFWRLVFTSAGTTPIATYYSRIIHALQTAPKSNRVQLTRIPLGGNPNRYMGRHGNRVGPSGTVLTGPDLIRRR